MAKYVTVGGRQLQGTVKISGNKNSVFPCLSAALLTTDEVIINNVPNILDTRVSLEILKSLGVETEFDKNTIKIKAKNINSFTIPDDLIKRLRGSIVFAGGILGRTGKVNFSHPGGDVIGKRSIGTHLEGFRKLGYGYEIGGKYHLFVKDLTQDADIFLDEASVTATENLIIASILGKRQVVLKNLAKEPHVMDLCRLLIKMGAKIEGVGESTLKISGVSKLHGCEYQIGCDYIEFGTFAIAAAITKGKVEITGCQTDELEPLIIPLIKMGLNFVQSTSSITVSASDLKAVPKVITNIWPGYPTDMMSLTIVLATQANGVTLCHDWMYESRMFFVDKLISMGANITIADPHRVVVYGPTKLYGRELESPDIRAGMALVLAALVAQRESIINNAELIERGYEDVVEKLTRLGADIERVE